MGVTNEDLDNMMIYAVIKGARIPLNRVQTDVEYSNIGSMYDYTGGYKLSVTGTTYSEDIEAALSSSKNYIFGTSTINPVNLHPDVFLWKKPQIKKVIFNDPATIVFWEDGTKTVVKCQKNDTFDKMTGLAMAISKKYFGNEGRYYNHFKKFIEED